MEVRTAYMVGQRQWGREDRDSRRHHCRSSQVRDTGSPNSDDDLKSEKEKAKSRNTKETGQYDQKEEQI